MKRQEERIFELLSRLENPSLENTEEVDQFYREWMELVWDHKIPGKLFDFYAQDIMVYRENGNNLHGVTEVVKDVLQIEAAFPDVKITIGATVVVGNKKDGYQIFARRYINGTSLGSSPYGPPTNAILEGDKCMSLDMLKIMEINGRWQVVSEYMSQSTRTIRVAMGGSYEI